MPGERTAAEIEAELAAIDASVRGEGGDPDLHQSDEGGDPDEAELAAENEAGKKGWVPKDKFKGPAEKWKPASQFLADGQRFQKDTQRELERLRAQVADFEGTKKQFAAFHEELLANKQRELDEAISALRIQRSQAVREGDDELSIQLEDRIDLLKEQKTKVKEIPASQKPAVDENNNITGDNPILNDWVEDNTWFRDDAKLRAYAVQLGGEMRAGGLTLQGRAFLDKVTEKMREEFPRQFKVNANPHGSTPRVEGGSSSGEGGGSKYSERDLPAEDLALMKDFIRQGFTTREKFLANYFSDAPRKHASK